MQKLMQPLMAAMLTTTLIWLTACATTSQATDKNKFLAQTHYDIAITRFKTGDLRETLRELLKTIELNPELAEAHNALGMVYHALEHLDESLTHYEAAVKFKPTFSEAFNNMGTLLIDLGRYDDAIESFQVAIGDILYRTPALAEGNMGWAYYKKGEVTTGRKHLRNAVATQPKFCRGYEWLARIALDQDTAEGVDKIYRRFDRHCAQDAEVGAVLPTDYIRQMQYYFALSLIKTGRVEQAREMLSRCALKDAEKGYAAQCQASLQELSH
jgi:type IV pilus biogenesis/stability protein PilW